MNSLALPPPGRAIIESCERAARDAGFTNLVLGATLPGEPLYRAF